MSDEPSNHTHHTRKKLGGPYSPEERAEKQSRFLEMYRECGNIKYSCQFAGISRDTFYQWKKNSKTFQQLLEEAEPEVDDTVEYAAYEEGVLGVEEPMVSLGRIMYHEEPELNEDGTPKLDSKGRPMMKRGEMVTIRKRNPTVLLALLKARMPNKYRDRQSLDVQANVNHSGGITLDTREMTQDELATLRTLGENLKKRQQG